MNNRDPFEELNLELIAARKAILERDRILDMMAALDVELAEKLAELPLLEARRQLEWLDVAELESTGIATIVFSALGRHEQLLAQQLQEYLEAKLAYEQCQQRISALQHHLARLNDQLVALADCDEIYQARQAQQKELLLRLDTAEARQLQALTESIAQQEMLLPEVEEALAHGRTAQTTLISVQNRLGTLQKSAIRYYELLDVLLVDSQQAQSALDAFTRELQDIGQLFWQDHDPQRLELTDTPFSFLTLAAQLLAAATNDERLKLWQQHIDRLVVHMNGLLETVDGRAAHLRATLTQLYQDQSALIETMWQPDKFPEE
ncbi:MAG TPA: hypothetical protein PLD25_04945 [Chloroflexota bacterium]|nr:hypothetical protein [Chloroflexota bacterium]HUM70136.1 hypothetical protein [Chloroflexota bacterium]